MYDKRLGAEKPAKGVEQTVTKSKFSGFSGIIIDGVSASHTSEVFVKGGSPKGTAASLKTQPTSIRITSASTR